jgi:hypothetical protein
MQDVADDCHPETAEVFFIMTDGVHIEHRLGRVRMLTVSGVEHRNPGAHMLREEERAAAVLVADNEHVDLHRFQVLQRIEQGFAFDRCRGVDVEAENIGR